MTRLLQPLMVIDALKQIALKIWLFRSVLTCFVFACE